MCPNKKINYLIIEWNALAEIFNIAVKTDVGEGVLMAKRIPRHKYSLRGLNLTRIG